jgi:hypothetical protein
MPSPIMEKVYEHYSKLLHETERVVYSIMLTQVAKQKDIKELNLLELIKSIHNIDNVCVSFDEGEIIVGERYEIHSVSGQRDEDGEPMVFVNIYEMDEGETLSVRLSEFPHIADMLKIITAVDEKCSLRFSGD